MSFRIGEICSSLETSENDLVAKEKRTSDDGQMKALKEAGGKGNKDASGGNR